MRVNRSIPIMLALLCLGLLGLSLLPREASSQSRKPKADQENKKTTIKAEAGREADLQGIHKAAMAFRAAFEKGDAKAVANFWTEQGEYISDDGTIFHGRDAIAKAYAALFLKNPKLKLNVNIESIRFISKDSAVEEGYAKVHRSKDGSESSSRYSVLHVRENGNWLMALVREWPDEGTTLRDIDWIIGTWNAKTKNAEILMTYRWGSGKTFIIGRFTIKEKNRTSSGREIIGKDPRSGQLHSWIFESGGGFGESVWSDDGKQWVLEATGVLQDGTETTATNIIHRLGKDAFTWRSTDRTQDEEEMEDIPPVKVTRVK
jgi:uncharacterized protein (TIGR02246 family)